MKDDIRSSAGGSAIAVAIGLVMLTFVLLGVAGFAFGFLFYARSEQASIAREQQAISQPSTATAELLDKMRATPVAQSPTAKSLSEYPLSTLDMKDTLEAPSLAIGTDDSVRLAFASQISKEQRSLRLASLPGDEADEARELRQTAIYQSVSQQDGKEVKRPVRLMPQLVRGGDKLFLGWLEPNADNSNVFYFVAESSDGGATFGEPWRVHESDGARPNFTSLAADAQGNVVASWLDSRAGLKQPFAAVRRAGQPKFDTEIQVYASPEPRGVCPCCPTAAHITPDGQVHVAFRNQLAGQRDIFLASLKLGDDKFGEPARVLAAPTWTFDGCPHDGPALASDGHSLFVGWMDASSGTPRCYVAARPLGGGAFAPAEPMNAATTGAQGNLKLLAEADGALHAVWEESPPVEASDSPDAPADKGHAHGAPPPGSSRAIYHAIRTPRGEWLDAVPLLPRGGAYQTRPSLGLCNDGAVVAAWNELGEQGKQVVVVQATK